MRQFRRFLLLIVVLITAVILILILGRRDTQAAIGPAVARCPGPDLYGYTCEDGTAFAYIDATHDTGLYTDDGTITIDLPFPFTFYGTTYTQITAGSNGNVQFGSQNAAFNNACLTEGPAPELGDMIAPFWDDLDLTFFGFLETEVVGETPNRIFVIEWDDVPILGDDEDRVTFELQLFETSHDILFLYEDATLFTGNRGNSATIGLQSAAQGVALQYSCNQPAVADTSGLHIPHPDPANADLGLDVVLPATTAQPVAQAKGELEALMTRINQRGAAALPALRTHWLSQQPPRDAEWATADFTGNGRSDLLILRHSTTPFPQYTDLILLAADAANEMHLALHHQFSTRETAVSQINLLDIADLTGDGIPDALIEGSDHRLYVGTAVSGTFILYPLPEQCRGSSTIIDTDQDGLPEIVRDGCSIPGRLSIQWNGFEFAVYKP